MAVVFTTPRARRRPMHGLGDDLTAATPQLSPIGRPWNNTQTTASPSTDPIAYVSPQSAIAAGLDPTTVYQKWRAYLATFPSAEAAVQAGIPAGVVRDLWTGAAPPAPWIQGSTFGIPNGLLLLAGIVGVSLAIARGEGEL